ncbi:siderophore-interacting protein [Gordonia oryzae]|nr:siderophore-interacting protein [Gordonia oryzae]
MRTSAGLLRVVLDIGEAARDSTWARPNVAVRIGLDDAEARSRVYTVRDADLDAARITLDVVQHGADSPMMRWSTVLRVGDADRVRLRTYNSLMAQCKTLADLDDLALEVGSTFRGGHRKYMRASASGTYRPIDDLLRISPDGVAVARFASYPPPVNGCRCQ